MDADSPGQDDARAPAGYSADASGSLAETLAYYTRSFVSAAGPLPEGERDAVRVVTQACVAAARELGLIMPFPMLEARRYEADGQEHDVWFEREADPAFVYKATKVGSWGLVPGQPRMSHPLDYLERVWLANRVFGFPWELQGLWLDPFGRPRMVTTQGLMVGDPAAEEEIEAYLGSHGFVLQEDEDGCAPPLWINADLCVAVSDAYPDNFVRLEDGLLMPIDVAIALIPH